MRVLLATVGAYTGSGLLLFAGAAHAASQGTFRELVTRQAVWPRRVVTPVTVAVAAAELLVGLWAIASVLTAGAAVPAPAGALWAASLLYLAIGGYGTLLWWRRPGAPCACSDLDHPVGAWVPLRAFALAAGCAYAAGNATQILAWSATAQFLLALLASAGFLVLAWSVPSAFQQPDDLRPPPTQREPSWISRPAR
jgi:hypothetical protein